LSPFYESGGYKNQEVQKKSEAENQENARRSEAEYKAVVLQKSKREEKLVNWKLQTYWYLFAIAVSA
jgi:hypothetical protein